MGIIYSADERDYVRMAGVRAVFEPLVARNDLQKFNFYLALHQQGAYDEASLKVAPDALWHCDVVKLPDPERPALQFGIIQHLASSGHAVLSTYNLSADPASGKLQTGLQSILLTPDALLLESIKPKDAPLSAVSVRAVSLMNLLSRLREAPRVS